MISGNESKDSDYIESPNEELPKHTLHVLAHRKIFQSTLVRLGRCSFPELVYCSALDSIIISSKNSICVLNYRPTYSHRHDFSQLQLIQISTSKQVPLKTQKKQKDLCTCTQRLRLF
ncbi:hypothetical protein ACOME3_007014 [Neoechinorhynchus agilis]